MATRGETQRELRDFLIDSFTVEDFEQFLRDHGFAEIAHTVSAKAAAGLFFSDVIRAMNHRGRIDGAFFARLARERPLKAAQIDHLEEAWSAAEPLRPEPADLHRTDSAPRPVAIGPAAPPQGGSVAAPEATSRPAGLVDATERIPDGPPGEKLSVRLARAFGGLVALAKWAFWWAAFGLAVVVTLIYSLMIYPPDPLPVASAYVLELILASAAAAWLCIRFPASVRRLLLLGVISFAVLYSCYYVLYFRHINTPFRYPPIMRVDVLFAGYDDRFITGSADTDGAIAYGKMNRTVDVEHHHAYEPIGMAIVFDYLRNREDPEWMKKYGPVFGLKDRLNEEGIWVDHPERSPWEISKLIWTPESLWRAQFALHAAWFLLVAAYAFSATVLFLWTRGVDKDIRAMEKTSDHAPTWVEVAS